MIPVLLLDATGAVIREIELPALVPYLYVPVAARTSSAPRRIARFDRGDEESYPPVYRFAWIA